MWRTNNNLNIGLQHLDLSMKKSGCIKAYFEKKNKTKGLKQTNSYNWFNIMILNIIFLKNDQKIHNSTTICLVFII